MELNRVSNCYNTSLIEETDICSKCKEHCEIIDMGNFNRDNVYKTFAYTLNKLINSLFQEKRGVYIRSTIMEKGTISFEFNTEDKGIISYGEFIEETRVLLEEYLKDLNEDEIKLNLSVKKWSDNPITTLEELIKLRDKGE